MRIAAITAFVIAVAACSPDAPTDATSSGPGCDTIVHVFLTVGTTKERERRVGQVIDSVPFVLRSTFHPNVKAYREFKKLYEKEPQIYESKKASDFPSRYEVALGPAGSIDDLERSVTGATTGIDRLVPGGCASESPTT